MPAAYGAGAKAMWSLTYRLLGNRSTPNRSKTDDEVVDKGVVGLMVQGFLIIVIV